MARKIPERDISPVLSAAAKWIDSCLINDNSVLGDSSLWNSSLIEETQRAFVDHPDGSENRFIAKLKIQMKSASQAAQQLMAEMLWALLLFPSNVNAKTKRQQILDVWGLSGRQLSESTPALANEILGGIGSAGPGFNNYRPRELAFLISVARSIKSKSIDERQHIFGDYGTFIVWIESVPQEGRRQFRHMLRYFAFPDLVERMSSNRDRQNILEAFGTAKIKDSKSWSDRELDEALLRLRDKLQIDRPGQILDFYRDDLKSRWSKERQVNTEEGPVTVVVPGSEDEEIEDEDLTQSSTDTQIEVAPDVRQSIQIQAKLAEIGAIMGYKVWAPRSDRARIRLLVADRYQSFFLEDLPLNYDDITLNTIEQIDILWLKGRSMARAFEVEHTTAVYSGLLRMADLLALQPNMDIRLHIVAPEERRDKVFREMLRPVFSLLGRGPLSKSCTFLSYDSVETIRSAEHLAYIHDGILKEFEEEATA